MTMSDEVFDKELGEIESQIVSLRYALFQLRKKYSNKESKKDEEIQEIQTIGAPFTWKRLLFLPIMILRNGSVYSHILCTIKPFDNPDIYWHSLEKNMTKF